MPALLVPVAWTAVVGAAGWAGFKIFDGAGTLTKWVVIGGTVYVGAKAFKVI